MEMRIVALDGMEKQPIVLIIVAIVAILSAVVTIILNVRRTNKTMNTIENMLSKAQNAEFSEADFDESRLSKLETMFAHYLSSSATSSRNIEVEKKKIETLIADISHQTKTPIANLLLYTELLSEDNLTEDTREKVECSVNYAPVSEASSLLSVYWCATRQFPDLSIRRPFL